MKNFFLALIIGSCLIGDNNGCITDMNGILISTPNHAQIHYPIVFPKTTVDRGMEVSTSIVYDGIEQSREDAEKAGFYSVITSGAL